MWTVLRRIRAAAALLFLPGDRMPVTRHELEMFRIEWTEWQLTFTSVLEKLNAWQARQAKREKRALDRGPALPPETSAKPHDRRTHKLALWRRASGAAAPAPEAFAPQPLDAGDAS
jgi:hypothetical protein